MAALDNIASELLKSANEADLIYKRTRDQAQRDKAVRLRRIVENLKAISAGGLTPTLDEVLTEGNVSTNTLNVGGITSDYFQLDTAATPTPVQGMMFWDSDRSTVDVQLDADVSAKIGQDNFWYVKNQSGATIPKGKAVMAVGTLGASGRILIDEMVANGSISSKFLLGITAEDIANGADGFVMNIGKLRQVNTTIWPDGTVLYCDPTTAGNLTSTKPSSPNLALPVAFVVHSAVNGVLAIRVSILDENAFNTPTLAQVTTAGNTTTNAITVGGLTVATNLIYTDLVNNRVGINTASPTRTLDVNGTQAIIRASSTTATNSAGIVVTNSILSRDFWFGRDSSVGNGFGMSSPAYAGVINARGPYPLYIGANDLNILSLLPNGNVLIGTTTDAGYKLDVNGTARVQGAVVFSNSNISNLISIQSSTSTSFIWQGNNTSAAYQQNNLNIQPYTGSLGVHISNADGSTILYGRTSTTGDSAVGVGTMNPLAKFEVSGNRTAASALARGVYFNNTLVAAANNDVLVGLDINPTFTNGAFTGVTNLGLRSLSGFNLYSYGVAGGNNGHYLYAITNNISATDGLLHFRRGGGHNGITRFQLGGSFQLSSDDASGEVRMNVGAGGYFSTFYSNGSEAMRIPTSRNVLIGTTTDAGYKLDVAGTFRAVVGTETNPFRLEHTNGNYMTMIVGNGSALAAGQFGMYFNGGPMWSWNGAAFRLHGNVLSTANNPSTLILQGGYGGSTVGTSMKLSSNTPNQGQWTATSGSQITVEIGNHSNETWAPSSGNASYTLLSVAPRINTTGTYAGVVRGIYYNPTLTSLTGTTHRAIETTSGNVIFNGGNVGIGTTTPTELLHIVNNTNGNKFARISAGGTDASAAWVAQNDQVDNVVYRVFGSAVTGTQMGISLARSASLMANLGGTGKFLIGTYSSTDFVMGTGNQERMRLVDSTGNFLIGTTVDNGNKLQVSGTIDSTGYRINNIAGYTGILNIPGNPPGQQNVDIQGGIVINIF